jgi:hypothetical protein
VILSTAAQIQGTGVVAQIAAIYKNGSILASGVVYTAYPANSAKDVTIEDVANGSDVYTAYCYGDVSPGDVTILGAADVTFFAGVWIGP